MSIRTPGDVPIGRVDRVLAFMSLGLLVLSIVCFFAIIIGRASGADLASGVWPAIGLTTYLAPPLAFVLLIVVLIRALVKRARANRGS